MALEKGCPLAEDPPSCTLHDLDCACMQHADLLYRTVVNGLGDLIVVFDDEGTIVFANRASRSVLGYEPSDLQGRSVFDFIHPADHDRALRSLVMNRSFGAAPGLTAFRLLCANGDAVVVDMTGGIATDDGTRTLHTSASRINENRAAMQSTLSNLLDGAPLQVALRSVCDLFTWQANRSQIGVTWVDGSGSRGAVSTGIDLDLVGAHDDASVWSAVRRGSGPIVDLDLAHLDPGRRAKAQALGLAAYWIEPVPSAMEEPATITVWTSAGRRPPSGHDLGMATARSVVEMILRWSEQQRRLDLAASRDPLTSLANRATFFDAVNSSTGGGVVLYCDLDDFKAVNDRFGHGAGDELLRQVALRLSECVRSGDTVARLGGDEFAILCPHMSPQDAAGLTRRIRDAITRPFDLGTATVHVGISVGFAHDTAVMSETLLDAADRELYVAKQAR